MQLLAVAPSKVADPVQPDQGLNDHQMTWVMMTLSQRDVGFCISTVSAEGDSKRKVETFRNVFIERITRCRDGRIGFSTKGNNYITKDSAGGRCFMRWIESVYTDLNSFGKKGCGQPSAICDFICR